jgi:glycosyltransferase involved in cell wall biosynthesis
MHTIPFFSIIIGTYNRRKHILTTLASLREQTLSYDDFEIIIVDNSSNDETAQAIEAYVTRHEQTSQPEGNWHVHYIKETQHGLACMRNTGVCHAKGKVVVFLNDDTLTDKTFLERLLTTYNETGADVVGGSVDILWEAPRPYWLFDDLLEIAGYFHPFDVRTQISAPLSLSNLNFSIKRLLLLEMGGFVPFLLDYPETTRSRYNVKQAMSGMSSSSAHEKQLNALVTIEIPYLCRQLQRKGYTLWYDPAIRILRRISQTQLRRGFFISCAYWDGRAEAMINYLAHLDHSSKTTSVQHTANIPQTTRGPSEQSYRLQRDKGISYWADWREFLQLALLHRPLLALARKSARERLMAAIMQSHLWGRIRQSISLANHAPSTIAYPDILLLQANEQDGLQLQQGFQAIGLYCLASIACLPLSWLWRHRIYKGNIAGVIHCYRPGAFQLSHWQRQQLVIRLWLAQRMGIPLVTTDAGGWWQHTQTLAVRQHQAFEQYVFHNSNLILSYSRHTAQLYPDFQLRRRVRSLPYPGFYGLIPDLITRDVAIDKLHIALPTQQQPFIYLCFAHNHSEREIHSLIDTFSEVQKIFSKNRTRDKFLHLILVGTACDNYTSEKRLAQPNNDKHIHMIPRYENEDIAIYLAASDALVVPHTSIRAAGTLDMAYLWYSYEKIVVIPDLPRFQDVFPSHACLVYDSGSHLALVQALYDASYHTYRHTAEERNTLTVDKAWKRHAQRIQRLHKHLFQQ